MNVFVQNYSSRTHHMFEKQSRADVVVIFYGTHIEFITNTLVVGEQPLFKDYVLYLSSLEKQLAYSNTGCIQVPVIITHDNKNLNAFFAQKKKK